VHGSSYGRDWGSFLSVVLYPEGRDLHSLSESESDAVWEFIAFVALAFLFLVLGVLGLIMPGAGVIFFLVVLGIFLIRRIFTP